jgi:thymidylate synthase
MSYVCQSYDDALREILDTGVRKTNRTGVETLAVWCIEKRYDISEHWPLITGRKLTTKALFGELLWFLEGSTNNNRLRELGCNFWTPWVDEEFEKRHGFEPGSFGPLYGFQLRYFGGSYNKGIEGNGYGRGGVDQLAQMMDKLKTDPDCRRNLFSLWNPQQLEFMRLPPCHYTFQVFVENGRLSSCLTQRSCDFPVGIPFNIGFYSALTMMLAQQAGLEAHEFVHSTKDCHIYADQIDKVEEYLAREKPDSPKLRIRKAKDIFSYVPSDFEVVDYKPQPKMDIAVAV